MKSRFALPLCALFALALTGCPGGLREPQPPPAAVEAVPGVAVIPAGAQVYEVDDAASEVRILVFRGGRLARLGHNHVVTVDRLQGRAWTHAEPSKSGFALEFAVADMVVDDEAARREAGDDFPPGLSESDKEATRRNMLRPEMLDAEQYPTIGLQSVDVAGPRESPRLRVRITIKDVTQEVEVAAAVVEDSGTLTARGEFDIRQTEFGITPFSAAFGALTVEDVLKIRFRVVATRR